MSTAVPANQRERQPRIASDGDVVLHFVRWKGLRSRNHLKAVRVDLGDDRTKIEAAWLPDGERILTFHGEVNGNEISFIREITVLDGGSRGRNGLYGGATALGFVAKRAAQPSQLQGH